MATSTLPLHCSICPKKPNFSDTSHLLTHIASKGHLSHYYKVKLRAAHDQDAKDLIDLYDSWYDEWRVEDLMAERLLLREARGTKRRNKGQLVAHHVRAHD